MSLCAFVAGGALMAIPAMERAAWADDSSEAAAHTATCDPADPGLLAGQATCNGSACLGLLQLSVEGRKVSLSDVASAAAAPPGGQLVVRAKPNLAGRGDPGAVVRLDLQADGFADEHVFVHVPLQPTSEPEGVCMTLHRTPNLRVTLAGPGAAATTYARLRGDDHNAARCLIDTATGPSTCEMYVPPGAPGTEALVDVRIVGTVNTLVSTYVKDGMVTDIGLPAPRSPFTLATDVGVAAVFAVGVGVGIGLVQAGESKGGDLGLDIAAASVTAVTFAGTYLLIKFLGSGRVKWTTGYRYPNIPQLTPTREVRDAPSFSSLPARSHVTAGLTPSGFAVQW